MDSKARHGVIFVSGKIIPVFLDGRGFAFDDLGNEFQNRALAGQRRISIWIKTRCPHRTFEQLPKLQGKLKDPKIESVIKGTVKSNLGM
jgi:hypothetical protein